MHYHAQKNIKKTSTTLPNIITKMYTNGYTQKIFEESILASRGSVFKGVGNLNELQYIFLIYNGVPLGDVDGVNTSLKKLKIILL